MTSLDWLDQQMQEADYYAELREAWLDVIEANLPDDCETRPDGHLEGCPNHCTCYDEDES